MPSIKFLSLILMAGLYMFAGISHFTKPNFFLKIMPKWVPYPKQVNHIIGFIETFLGLALLFNATRHYAAIGIIVLLIVVFPANIYHFQLARKKDRHVIPTLIRLPLQFLLIYWAYSFV